VKRKKKQLKLTNTVKSCTLCGLASAVLTTSMTNQLLLQQAWLN